jgi:four helix bundle protein
LGDKIDTFEKLRSWQLSIDFAVEIYKITDSFPKTEQFGLTSQLRRASSGVSANIAEGFGRQSNKEKIQFYNIAYGSLTEAKSFLYLAEKLGYISSKELDSLKSTVTALQKMINASKKALR